VSQERQSDGSWLTVADRLFIYDGWRLLCEQGTYQGNALRRRYTWGLDLSRTLAGAGGIGGLLAVSDGPTTPADYVYCYDGNGNVGQVLDLAPTTWNASAVMVARYEYDPYGRVLSQAGAYADPASNGNPFQFSTKYYDHEVGLIYFGYRYYSPRLGRWVNRDPIGEIDAVSLYIALRNDPIAWVDSDGHRATRTDRRDRRTDRRDRWPDRRNRPRLLGGDFASDWAGREILWHYLYGRGVPVEHIHDPRWSQYMMDSLVLTDLTQRELRNIALLTCKTTEDGSTVPVDHVCQGMMENGEGIIGHQYLHGSNAKVGGYKIQGTATKTTVLRDGQPCCVVSFNVDFEWNDIIDPNPDYDTDTWKAWFADIVWKDAWKYDIKIRWHSESVFSNCCGRERNSGGWPYQE